MQEDEEIEIWKCHQCDEQGEANNIIDLTKSLSDEIDELARDDLQGNLECLKRCREFLHCNHSLLTELRVRIIPIICR